MIWYDMIWYIYISKYTYVYIHIDMTIIYIYRYRVRERERDWLGGGVSTSQDQPVAHSSRRTGGFLAEDTCVARPKGEAFSKKTDNYSDLGWF